MKKALITGIAGQDGSYLAELLLGKGYEVHGLLLSKKDAERNLGHLMDKIIFHEGDICDSETVFRTVSSAAPEEIYHLATKHDLENSLENYETIVKTNIDSTYHLLDFIKNKIPKCRFFFASSSRVFGFPGEVPQSEATQMDPKSLYGISKLASMQIVKMFREKEGIYACSGILYNHESPRRDQEYLSRKISKGIAEIKKGISKKIKLGDLDARRDWSFAGDIAEAMWLVLQAEKPGDYVFGSGESNSVKDFLDIAFRLAGLDWKEYIEIDAGLSRPKETELRADIKKAKEVLGWHPKTEFKELVKMMVEADMKSIK